MKSSLQKAVCVIERLSKADLVFYLMPALIVLLLVGTIAQKYMGLYAAHKMFFASFIFWVPLGDTSLAVPLPGGYLLIGLITVFLGFKFLFHSNWRREKAGIHITHLGVLILLVGGFLTALSAREGFVALPEGGESPYVYDYIEREIIVLRDEAIVGRYNLRDLAGFENTPVPFDIEVVQSCENCEIERREDSAQNFPDTPLQSFTRFMALKEKPRAMSPEEHLSGITFIVSGAGAGEEGDQDGLYMAFEAMPKPISIMHDGHLYEIILGKAQRLLPFSVQLRNFVKDVYPGTNQARSYYSDLIVKDGDIRWPVRIEMNEPLRYKGYTLYQASFEQGMDGQQVSILSVVENQGRIFPYIGTLVIALGLILHLVIVMRRGRR